MSGSPGALSLLRLLLAVGSGATTPALGQCVFEAAGRGCTQLSWSSLLAAAVPCFGQSIDNLAVGMGYAVSNRPLAWQHNVLIALLNAGGTLLTMETGDQVLKLLPGEGNSSSARAVGGYILVLLGVKELLCGGGDRAESLGAGEGTGEEEEDGEMLVAVSVDDQGARSRRLQLEVVALAFGLTFTNLAGGFTAGVAGLPVFPVCVVSWVRLPHLRACMKYAGTSGDTAVSAAEKTSHSSQRP
jgi:putative Mn2+ efflux pump MntP